ncbi:hypothetical protein VNO77_07835 [Canavalia gladiata]|uniref:Uncharacterized protein n=1 Tax=Canavalia gladiata TaxID=3824 RepID=A0AAN9M8S4_CANGL
MILNNRKYLDNLQLGSISSCITIRIVVEPIIIGKCLSVNNRKEKIFGSMPFSIEILQLSSPRMERNRK